MSNVVPIRPIEYEPQSVLHVAFEVEADCPEDLSVLIAALNVIEGITGVEAQWIA